MKQSSNAKHTVTGSSFKNNATYSETKENLSPIMIGRSPQSFPNAFVTLSQYVSRNS